MDIVGALIALVLLSPLFLLIAGIIRAVSPGPAFHKQQRIGYRGRSFMIWKFRTMRVDADAGLHQVHLSSLIESDAPLTKLDFKEDPRIFPFGRFMRRCCLDELPQLINVLRGEMSLVGPRPCMPYEAEAYRLWQRKRFDSLPGMTGLWQVSGKNRTTFKEMLRLDIRYSKAKSMRLDLWIIAKTAQAIAAEYAYHSRQRAGASR
jgi:lipopolysaccharide/colanic/teichoic acid biosynthesis glycosyltransferase